MDTVLPVTDDEDPDPLTLIFPASQRGDGIEEEEDEDGEPAPIPYNPFGAIFLRPIMLKDVPRMRVGGPSLSATAFKFLFGDTEEGIRHKYYRTGIIPRQAISSRRVVTNKSTRTPTYIPEPGTTPPVLFNLAERNIALPPPAVDSGSDWESEQDSAEDSKGIDETITQLYRQFITDVMSKSPNPRGANNPSYCILTRHAKLTVTEDIFKNPRLPDVWRACQYKLGTPEDFKRVFNHLFPPRHHKTSSQVQNYLQCQYYMKWKEICVNADAATVQAIRRDIAKKISSFVWLPDASQDKMWPTKHISHFEHYPPDTPSNAPAPRLLFRRQPEW
jgi:hypothetical protein